MDTIFAVSSGAPPAAIAVLRLSGPAAGETLRMLAGDIPPPRKAALRALRDPEDGELLDRALLLFFPGPSSATGEDLAELHLHGGRAVVRAVEAVLARMPGLRPAEAGEFTRRALTHGRIDLSEAEGLGDLLAAETEAQRRVAIRAVEGAVRREVDGWTLRLLQLAAQIEALLDHADEDDVVGGAETFDRLRSAAAELAADIDATIARPAVERLRDGLRVVLAGPPNAGKSTLLNALTEREAAIVSPIAGTTRDRIEAPVVRGGTAYLFVDTAGIHDAPGDAIEGIGIDRARQALAEADIVLWLGDETPPAHPAMLWIQARADLPGRGQVGSKDLSLSVLTGVGVMELWERLGAFAQTLLPPPDMVIFNRRQRQLASIASSALRRSISLDDLILLAEELRSARTALDAISGRAGVEDMLDALFSRFCIGK